MKKILIFFTLICSLLVFTSCELEFDFGSNTPTEEVKEKYAISFYTFELAETPETIVDVTFIPSALPKLSVEGYEFYGWYYDVNFTKKAFPADLISSNIILYAKFVEIKEVTETGPVVNPTDEPTFEDIPTNEPTGDNPTQSVTPDTPTENVPTVDNTPTFDDTNKLVSSQTCVHTFVNLECSKCDTDYDPQVFNIFKSNTIIYDNDSTNPYNINLDTFGSDVKVIFYEADTRRDIYSGVTKEGFYSNYKVASSYEEAYFRTQHKFMSGDIADQSHLTPTGKVMSGSNAVRCTTAIYILDYQGNYLGYIPNNYNGDNHVIWYGGAYISHNDVAAYLFAFGEVPINNYYDKNNGRNTAISHWGKYGRVNYGSYSNNTSKYPYEPRLVDKNGQKYIETDFGAKGGFTVGGKNQSTYNNGSSITRGTVRFCFVTKATKNTDLRYVFYTYNHYNDFQEYLNYDDGFGVRFGNESNGNPYYSGSGSYTGKPSQYPSVVLKTYNDLLNLI